jgi:hypothetical protein
MTPLKVCTESLCYGENDRSYSPPFSPTLPTTTPVRAPALPANLWCEVRSVRTASAGTRSFQYWREAVLGLRCSSVAVRHVMLEKKTSGLYQFSHHSPSRTLGAFVPTDSPFFRTVREHPIAGAFGRCESTLAFTHCSIRGKDAPQGIHRIPLLWGV